MVRGPSGALIISSRGSPVLFRLMVLKTIYSSERFQVFAIVTVQIRVVFWDFTLCSVFFVCYDISEERTAPVFRATFCCGGC